jgi:cytochrome c553
VTRFVIGSMGLQAALLTAVLAVADRVDGATRRGSSRGSIEAKIEYCKDCHGLAGQGYHGYLIMPRLAGQNPEYIENQLRAFITRTREKSLFLNMARVHGTSPDMQAALAAHFRDLNPPPFGGGPRQLAATGRQIYEDGIPEANVPACSACHGPEAKGQGPIPRLAGQLYAYTVKELTRWDKDRGQSAATDPTTAVMLPIAHNLNQSQISALAAYFSYLR